MKRKYKVIVGIDEVGRGALAGPITVAAVAATVNPKSQIPNPKIFKGIRDSKKLTAKQREEWALRLRRDPQFVRAIASVSAKVIDRVGIAAAARYAVAQVLRKLLKSDFYGDLWKSDFYILLDGALRAPKTYQNQQTIIRGDEKVPLIAAASIIAKVHRDRLMARRYHRLFPEYGFDRHKGYGTKAHYRAIRKNGACSLHRQCYLTSLERRGP